MKIIIPVLLLILASCQDIDTTKNAHLKDSSSSFSDNQKKSDNADDVTHQTFNESIDTLPEIFKAFIPVGYSAINISVGDANLDGLMDRILVLRKITEETTSNYAEYKPEKRPMLLLLGQLDDTYKLAFRNDNAIYCIDCGGVFGDPFTGITIKNGYFSIEHGIAGGRHWEQVTTFKFDKAKGNWFLYKDHYINYKLNDDEQGEALVVDIDKLETSKDFGTITFNEFNIYNELRR